MTQAVTYDGLAYSIMFQKWIFVAIICASPSIILLFVYSCKYPIVSFVVYGNFGEYQYANSSEIVMTGQRGANEFNPEYLEYEEGIYMGYRFYETAWYEKEQASEGSGDAWYSAWRTASDNRGTGVVYPFGHGLSYSTFTQKITDVSESDGEITVTVEVKNTSSVLGKDVVQIYYTAPYTEFDKSMSIEKSYVNLVGFGKTKELGQNDSDIVKITFSEEDMIRLNHLK